MKKKCSIYARNIELEPSSFYRIGQYLPFLDCNYKIHSLTTNNEFKKNLSLKASILKKLYQFFLYLLIIIRVIFYLCSDFFSNVSTIIIQRAVIPRYFPIPIFYLMKFCFKNKTIIWDFDDNIIESGEISSLEKDFLKEKSTRIIVTSNYLKESLKLENFEKVIMLPTTDMILSSVYRDDFIHIREDLYKSEINVLWVGTGGNLPFLSEIISYLDEAAFELQLHFSKALRLYIICNIPLNVSVKYLKIENIAWSRETVTEYMKKSHIGIMPLQDNYYTRGKAGFKLVQYMATGLPVVGSSVGYNNLVIDESSGFLINSNDMNKWKDSIITLSSNFLTWLEFSNGAREKFLKDFNPQINIHILNECINLKG